MSKPRIPLPKKVLFSDQAYSADFLNSVFKKLQERPEPFLGILLVEDEQEVLILFIFQSEPYAAGGWAEGGSQSMSLHEFFQKLSKMHEARLSLCESDPVYLKCLLGLIQKTPSTQATTEHVNIEELIDRLKQDTSENLLVLKRAHDFNLFYFLRQRLVEAYFANSGSVHEGGSLEDALLSYATAAGSGTLEVLLYTDLKVSSSQDAHQSITDDVIPAMVDYFLRPCPRLVLTGPQNGPREIGVYKKIFTIGRSSGNDLVLDDPSISRRHVSLRQDQEGYSIQDEESRNGVLVNGQQVSTARLSDKDEIQIGAYKIQFFLADRQEFPAPAAVPPQKEVAEVSLQQPPVEVGPVHQPKCCLEGIGGPLHRTVIDVKGPTSILGRKGADIILPDPKISHRHAMIEQTAQGYYYTDLGSTNGSFINGKRIQKKLLASGDVIRMGDTNLKVSMDR